MSTIVDPKSTGAYARFQALKPNSSSASTGVSTPVASSSSALGSAIGDIYSTIRDMSHNSASEVNQFNAIEAQKNRDWQEKMSNTAHQREVEDLIKAGLNPVLSANGNGAPVTSGSSASGVKSDESSLIASLYNTALNAQTSLQIAQIQASSAYAIAELNNQTKLDTSEMGWFTQFLEGLGITPSNAGETVAKIFDSSTFHGNSKGNYNTFDDFSWDKTYFGDLAKDFKTIVKNAKSK